MPTVVGKLVKFRCQDCFWEFNIHIVGETDRELFFCPACGKDSRKVKIRTEKKLARTKRSKNA